tara:strand:+ start:1198 stop:1845 length:648 start_codon:yes stop_codon:yes gene_type:complete
MKKEFEKRFLSSIILVPLSFFVIIKGSILFNLFLIICLLVAFYEWHMMARQKKFLIPGYFFLILSFYCTYNLRNHLDSDGLATFLFVIIICISTDIGGYLFGKFFKGPKLTKISPNKTYSGMIGSFFLSIVSINFFYYFSFFENFTSFTNKTMLIVFLISVISQIGDMTISFFKRLSKVKDTGKIIPGHGGLLDRIDGMIFAFPFSYLILTIYSF